MPVTFNSFTPSTKAQSAQVNANFTTIKTFLDGLRPTLYFPLNGAQTVRTNATSEISMKQALLFNSISMRCKTAPTDAAFIIDILKNGTSIFTTQPRIADGQTVDDGGAVFSGVSGIGVAVNDVLTVSVIQIGSTYSGADFTIALVFNH